MNVDDIQSQREGIVRDRYYQWVMVRNRSFAMQKACDFAACNHCGTPQTCGLNKLGVGCQGHVFAVGGDAEVRRRLLEMGFCNGAKVEVIRRAPMGDPIEFRLRGYHLSLREEQARHVQIVKS